MKNGPVNTKVGERGGVVAAGGGAEIPLQPTERTPWFMEDPVQVGMP